MGHIKEPNGIDFIINGNPLTDKEKKPISEFIKADKEKLFSSLGIATVILVSLTFLQMLLPNVTEYRIIIIAFMTFLLYIKTKIDPIYIILGAGFLGAFILG